MADLLQPVLVDTTQAQFEAAIELVERIFGPDSGNRHVDTVAAVLAAIQANRADEACRRSGHPAH
jgi:hypothetical protein